MSFNRFFDLPVPGANAPERKPAALTPEESSPPMPAFITQGARPTPEFEEVSKDDFIERVRHFMKQRNYQPAIDMLEKELKADPKNGMYHHLLGLSYVRMAYNEEDRDMASEVSDLWKEKGLKHLCLGSHYLPEDSQAAFRAGSYLNQAGRYEEAHDYLRRAVHLDQKDVFAWTSLAEVMIRMGRIDEGLVCVHKAYHCNPRDRKVQEILKRAGIRSVPPVADVNQSALKLGLTR